MRQHPLTEWPTAAALGLLLLALAACAGDPNSPLAQESNEAAMENQAADDVLLESDR